MELHRCLPAIVEADEEFAHLLTLAFLKAGLSAGNIRYYPSGESALEELLAAGAIPPSAMLLDLDLPGISGLAVLERIRSRETLAAMPAFLFSVRNDSESITRAGTLGAKAYWLKPQGFSPIWRIVRGILESL